MDLLASVAAKLRIFIDGPPPAPADETVEGRARALLLAYYRELKAADRLRESVAPVDVAGGRAILAAAPPVRIATIQALFDGVDPKLPAGAAWHAGEAPVARFIRASLEERARRSLDLPLLDYWDSGFDRPALRSLLLALLGQPLPYTADDLHRLLGCFSRYASFGPYARIPPFAADHLLAFLPVVKGWVAQHGLTPDVKQALRAVQAAPLRIYGPAEWRAIRALLAPLIDDAAPGTESIDPNDDWGSHALAALEAMPPDERTLWIAFVAHAATANGTKPTKPWLKRSRERSDAIEPDRFVATAATWLGFLGQRARHPARPRDPDVTTPPDLLAERNATLLRGLAWGCAHLDDPLVARALGDAAENSFKKVPRVGTRSTKAGNACVWTLGAMPGPHGVVQLQRLAQRVKHRTARALIDATLETAARAAGLHREDLDDLAVPTHDLVDGRHRVDLAPYAAEIVVAGPRQIDLRWFGPDGAPRRTEPAEAKRRYPDEIKALKREIDDLRTILPAQRDRIERLLATERSWAFADWRERYLDHPLLSVLARRLVWSFEAPETGHATLGAWRNDQIVNLDDTPLDRPTDETRVRLWHPAASSAEVVLAWQLWLERHEVTQPFKQAHREVYPLTDAERTTATYSNRFAAHVLRQHQMHALCRQRGWAFQLQGYDGANPTASLPLPGANLVAEFSVAGADGDETGPNSARLESGMYRYVATDQVRFRHARAGRGRAWGEAVPLAEVPPLVFSETLRDVDLFVGVCSVGNDPTWRDGGPERYRRYWQSYSFGDLSAAAETRRAVLGRLLPRLAIAPRCTIDERYLTVRGDLRTYHIHLGSGNIQMDPNNQYLCIVPGRGTEQPTSSDVFLPFEGDSLLSIILSKAFMLADDRAITDPTITRQINRA